MGRKIISVAMVMRIPWADKRSSANRHEVSTLNGIMEVLTGFGYVRVLNSRVM